MVWVKICGITNTGDAVKISSLGADAVGFILSTNSPRRISNEKAKDIIKALEGCKNKVSKVGVFVNEDVSKILQDAYELGLDYIQLSGDEDGWYLKEIKKNCENIKLIKSIRVKSDINSAYKKVSKKINELGELADFVLLDSYRKNIYGGTGISFNWDIIKDYSREIPIILSGGLDDENVARAINIVKPFGVDASSKLESYPGKKDLGKVKRFVKIVKTKSC